MDPTAGWPFHMSDFNHDGNLTKVRREVKETLVCCVVVCVTCCDACDDSLAASYSPSTASYSLLQPFTASYSLLQPELTRLLHCASLISTPTCRTRRQRRPRRNVTKPLRRKYEPIILSLYPLYTLYTTFIHLYTPL